MNRLTQITPETSESLDINMSPLIDMVFLLLIFFMVTTVFIQETGVDIDRPRAATAQQLENESILLALTPDGQIYHAGHAIGMADVRPLIRQLTEQQKRRDVVVLADEHAGAGLLVRVIDECKLGGATRVSVAAERSE